MLVYHQPFPKSLNFGPPFTAKHTTVTFVAPPHFCTDDFSYSMVIAASCLPTPV